MNVHYSSRKQKDDAEGDSEIIRADTLTTVPRDRTSSFSSHLARIPQTCCHPRRHVGRTFQRAAGAELWGWRCHCYDPERWDTEPERIILKTLEPMRVAFLGFGLTWDLVSPPFFPIFPFLNGTAYPWPAPSQYIGSPQLVWFPRFRAGEESCFRMNHTSSLLHMWLRWYLNETLNFRDDAETV